MSSLTLPLWSSSMLRQALPAAFCKLDPRHLAKNPVMFVVELGSVFTTLLWLEACFSSHADAPPAFVAAVALTLWATLLFANFAEAVAEGRGKAQAASLRQAQETVRAFRVKRGTTGSASLAVPEKRDAALDEVNSAQLRVDDIVFVKAGEVMPADGEVVEGVASVDESAITGESAPVIRESGGDRSAVTGGTRVLSDWLVVRVTANPGETFLDRMIAMVEGAKRQKTPNEVALDILLAALSIVFVLATVTLFPISVDAVRSSGQGQTVSLTVLVALVVCLIPTTIGALLSAIGIAGMDRMIRANVIATSGRAVEAAGDIDILLLDKTGTITLGNRQATRFLPAAGVNIATLADAAQLASLADETPEGRSIVVLAKTDHGLRGRELLPLAAVFVPFQAETRMSGVDVQGRMIRKGAVDAIARFVAQQGGRLPDDVQRSVEQLARGGATPLVVADGAQVLGVVELKDIVKGGIKERFAEMRKIGIKTIMITGDNPLTAAAIAAEAGVDDFLAEATPQAKLDMIRRYQSEGHLVAMTGDGTNDAPALAQADVAVAMNSGTPAAKEAGNMVDLDSNPTKLLQIVEIGKQMLITRGALTTFSIANDVAKYFAIIPAALVTTSPSLAQLNVMQLHSPTTAVLSAVIFNALIILALLPLAIRGVRSRAVSVSVRLRNNVLIFGVGGMLLPFPCIKLIDSALAAVGVQ